MIKIEKTDVFGWVSAIRGMRNPMNSWDKSDSRWGCIDEGGNFCTGDCGKDCSGWQYIIGENDLKLMKKLSKAGSDHSKFLRYIVVSFDVEAPLYWWKEMETYRVGVAENPSDIEFNSCSTMHKIQAKEFDMFDFSFEKLSGKGEDLTGYGSEWFTPLDILQLIIDTLNGARQRFLETKDKHYWWQMIQLLPSSYNQKRTVQLNYQVLKQMYFARRNHKLDEWHTLCDWIETLPYFKEIVLDE